jgi:phosphoribosylanthranilate isomerase
VRFGRGRSNDVQIVDLKRRGEIVKICGLRDPEHAAIAAAAGADMVGFIFAPTRRQVTAEVARLCVDAAKSANDNVLIVGVFLDAPEDEMQAVVELAGLDLVQFHGDQSPAAAKAVGVPVIQALRPRPGACTSDVIAQIIELRADPTPPVAFLVDGYAEDAPGGAGVRADWELARSVCALHPIMLAGGLNPNNARDAIWHVRPVGVDVSSGVEVDGIKNGELIDSFIREARSAFSEAR